MATRKTGVDLDLALNQLLQVRLENLASAPTHAVGRAYYDTVLAYARVSDGTNWHRASFLTDPFARANHTGTQVAATISDFNTAVRTNRLDQMAAPTASVSMGSQEVTNVASPTAASSAANRAYVDDRLSGQDWKDAVRVATAAALPAYGRVGNVITASANGALPNIDGVTLVVADRVLLKNGAAGADNGIYTVTSLGSGGAPFVLTRATDADSNAEVTGGLTVWVEEGSTNADTGWTLTTNNPIVLNTTPLAFGQSAASSQILAGTGLLKTGQTIDAQAGASFGTAGPGGGLKANTDDLVVDADLVARWKVFTIGDNAATSFVVNHALGHQFPLVQVALAGGTLTVEDVQVAMTDANNCTVSFNSAPASNAYKVTVVG